MSRLSFAFPNNASALFIRLHSHGEYSSETGISCLILLGKHERGRNSHIVIETDPCGSFAVFPISAP